MKVGGRLRVRVWVCGCGRGCEDCGGAEDGAEQDGAGGGRISHGPLVYTGYVFIAFADRWLRSPPPPLLNVCRRQIARGWLGDKHSPVPAEETHPGLVSDFSRLSGLAS